MESTDLHGDGLHLQGVLGEDAFDGCLLQFAHFGLAQLVLEIELLGAWVGGGVRGLKTVCAMKFAMISVMGVLFSRQRYRMYFTTSFSCYIPIIPSSCTNFQTTPTCPTHFPHLIDFGGA
jgi:hypothetical protein